jgi:exodeoxyribonuclease V beta subunit
MKGLDARSLRADLVAFAEDARAHGGGVRIEPLSGSGPRLAPAASGFAGALAAASMGRTIPRDWRVASYSWLAKGAESERPDHDQQIGDLEAGPEETEAQPADEVFELTRGTRAGHFLHALFERLDFAAGTPAEVRGAALELLGRYGLERRWEPVVSRTVERVLDTPLDGTGLRLRGVERAQRLDELEFHFPLAALSPVDLHRALAPFPAYRHAAEGLAFEAVRGLMKGFIDLVFRAGGRWYLVDYKSNHLGNRLEDYDHAGLTRAVRGHRYDLQYLIYTVALHRYLGLRQADYDYDDHFGGVYYLFLRGMRPEHGPVYGVFSDRPEGAVIEGLDGLFARADPSAGGGASQ